MNNKINSSWLQYFIFVFTDEFPIAESGVTFETLVCHSNSIWRYNLECKPFQDQLIPWVRHCVAWDQTTSARTSGVCKLIITQRSNHIKCDVQARIRFPPLWIFMKFHAWVRSKSKWWKLEWLTYCVCGLAWGWVLASLHACCLALILRMSTRPRKMWRGVGDLAQEVLQRRSRRCLGEN